MSFASESLRSAVIQRAGERCEYCLLTSRFQVGGFELDHIHPISRGGPTTLDNLAFACPVCNGCKLNHVDGRDSLTGEVVLLFSPRTQGWHDHFQWSVDAPFEFTVTRTGNSVGTATVNFAITGSGPTANRANATDFGSVLPSGTVSFAAGETSKTLNVSVRGDLTVETDEQFTVTLSNPSAGATLGTPTAIGRILNDEFVVEVLVDENGNLAINDLGGLTNNITVTRNTTTNMFVVTSPANELSPDGLSPTNTISIPVSSVTGGLIADLGPGNDKLTLSSLSLATTVLGGDGNDTVLGSGGRNLLLGEAGDDSLTGLTGNDTISGGIGKDVLTAGNSTGIDLLLEDVAGTVTLTATALTVSGVADTLSGFEQFSLTGGDGNDTIIGAAGKDTLKGGNNDDLLIGGNGVDSLSGDGGNDRALGGQGGAARGGNGLKDVGDVLSAEIIDELFADLFDFE